MPQRPRRKAAAPPGQVRIIAGEWRGRKLPVADLPGLRPTGDRARETLFNWLQPYLHGARCLDLFAGTGALGFEAASRGARAVTLVEKNGAAVKVLEEAAGMLGAAQVSIDHSDALDWLSRAPRDTYDLAFLDPPFDADLAQAACDALEEAGCLRDGARVYLESARDAQELALPPGWTPWRDTVQGQVRLQVFATKRIVG